MANETQSKKIVTLEQILSLGKLPLVVFADDPNGLFNWAIRVRSKGEYSHVMLLIGADGSCASQDTVGFRKIDINKYISKGYRLKFYSIKDALPEAIASFQKQVELDLKKGWWSRRYDYVGILGQLVGIRGFNIPNTNYCSENVAKYLQMFGIKNLGVHQTPSELNVQMGGDPRFVYEGHLIAD